MRERLDRVWPSLVALVGVVAVVVALLVLFGDQTGDDNGDDVAVGGDNGAAVGTDGTAPPTDEPASPPDETGDPSDESGEDSGDEAGDESADETGDDDPPDDETDGDPTPAPPELRTPVGIANQTSVEGLELRAQERLEAGGWEVAATSPFEGNIAVTTVYYPPGLEESAEALARQFPEIGRVNETVGNLNKSRLVVVLVEDYIDAVDE